MAGATGAVASQVVIDQLGQAIQGSQLPPALKQALVLAAGTAVGVAAGGTAGGATAFNATANNYLLHTELASKQQQLAACKDDACRKQVNTYWDRVSQDRNARTGDQIAVSGPAANARTMDQLSADMNNLAQYRAGLEDQLGATSDPARRASLQQQIAETDSSMRQVASQGKDALAVLYQQTGDAKYHTAFQALMAATGGSELGGALAMPGGGGGNAGRAAKEAKAAVNPVEQAAIGWARVENNMTRDGGVADPGQPMSATGPWAPVSRLDPAEANSLVRASLPPGVKIESVASAEAINRQFTENRPDFKPPFMPGTEVVDFTTTRVERFVRVSGEKSQEASNWIMRADEIAGLSPEQIASKFALPTVPTRIGDVTVPAGIRLQASVANGILNGSNVGGGGVQFHISVPQKNLPPSWFGSTRPINGH